MKTALVALVMFLAPAAAVAEEIVCSFASGVSRPLRAATWDKYEQVNEFSPLMLKFVVFKEAQLRAMLDGAKKDKDLGDIALVRGMVDRAAATGFGGWVEGADGHASPITAVLGEESVTFIEITGTGNVTTTTAFTKQKTLDGKTPAIHSRHMAFAGEGLVSQYAGACMFVSRSKN